MAGCSGSQSQLWRWWTCVRSIYSTLSGILTHHLWPSIGNSVLRLSQICPTLLVLSEYIVITGHHPETGIAMLVHAHSVSHMACMQALITSSLAKYYSHVCRRPSLSSDPVFHKDVFCLLNSHVCSTICLGEVRRLNPMTHSPLFDVRSLLQRIPGLHHLVSPVGHRSVWIVFEVQWLIPELWLGQYCVWPVISWPCQAVDHQLLSSDVSGSQKCWRMFVIQTS